MSRGGLDSRMSAETIEVRSFDPVHAQAVSTLIRRSWGEYLEPGSKALGMARLVAYSAPDAIAERARTHRTCVAWQGARPVGVIEVRETGRVSLLCVGELRQGGHDGLGVAMALMACAEETCRAVGQTGITVHSSLKTQSFYERLGFAAVDEPHTAHGLVFVSMAKEL
jgi:predicted N-acetyltransferase YhbS